jgi:hypothetical protein
VFWVAHASRVLVSASRRNGLPNTSQLTLELNAYEKSAMARRHRQHARRVRYPIITRRVRELITEFRPLISDG